MKNNVTELVFVLDRSGSMEPLTQETIGGFNALIEKRKKEEGELLVTVVLFDNEYEVLYDCVPIQDVKRLTEQTYYARGSTALLDAVGKTICRMEKRIAKAGKQKQPRKVIFTITTDGYENASRKYVRADIRKIIQKKSKKNRWQFVFLGANMDAFSEAASIGITPCRTAGFTANRSGVKSTFCAMDKLITYMQDNEEDDEFYEEDCETILSEVE